MGRKRKSWPSPEQRKVRHIFASNLSALLENGDERLRSRTSRYKEVAKKLDTSLSQIQRLADGAVGTSIDQLADIAELFQIEAWELLDPNFRSRYARLTERQPQPGSLPRKKSSSASSL